VPNVVGKSEEEAVKEFKKAGLDYKSLKDYMMSHHKG